MYNNRSSEHWKYNSRLYTVVPGTHFVKVTVKVKLKFLAAEAHHVVVRMVGKPLEFYVVGLGH